MKAYENYRDSKVDWIGKFPAHWNFSKLRWLSEIYAGGTPNTSNDSFWENGTIPWLNSGTVNQKRVTTASSYITQDALINSSTKWVPKGSLLMALAGQGKTKGTVAILEFDATCNQSMAAIIPNRKDINNVYLFYWLDSNYERIRGLAGTELRDGLNLQIVGDIYCPIPSINEQIKIAQYLDHQTAIIDQLIQQKEKLIELLKEERQGITNEAITKGLNPDARMKDSGIEWLGKVPQHWKITKLKFLVSLNSNVEALSETSFKVALENIESGTGQYIESIAENQFDGKGNYFKKGDVLFNKLRPYLAKVYLAEREGYSVGELLVFTPKAEITSEFLFYRVLSPAFIEMVNGSTYGAKMPRASWNYIGNLPIPFPSIKEQHGVVEFIKECHFKVNSLIAKSTEQIEKLKECRQSIISEAVTGKVDLRDWQPNKRQVA